MSADLANTCCVKGGTSAREGAASLAPSLRQPLSTAAVYRSGSARKAFDSLLSCSPDGADGDPSRAQSTSQSQTFVLPEPLRSPLQSNAPAEPAALHPARVANSEPERDLRRPAHRPPLPPPDRSVVGLDQADFQQSKGERRRGNAGWRHPLGSRTT